MILTLNSYLHSSKSARIHEGTKKTGTTVFVPHDVLKSSRLVSSSLQNKNLPTALPSTVWSLIVSVMVKHPKWVSVHHRWPMTAAKLWQKMQRTSRKPGVPHYSLPLMETLTAQYVNDDRLPILMTEAGGTKSLGVLALPVNSPERAGDLIANATMKLVFNELDCAPNVCTMVFYLRPLILGMLPRLYLHSTKAEQSAVMVL